MANKITVTSAGTVANANVTPDTAMYYSNKSRDWAISDRIVDNTDYSSKYYANESKKQADISTAKSTEVIESGNTAVSNIESARDNAITNVNTAGATQVALATEQATIATNKANEVIASGNTALANIDTAKDNAITSITNQETTSKTVLIDEGATQVGLIQNEGATQIANVQSTGFYMRDDKLYFINSQGEETEFKSGSGLEICDIGMALYVDETKGLRRYLNGQIVDINTNTQAFLNRLKEITTLHPSLLCTEEEWQTAKTMSAFGQVGKFVFNYSGNEIVSVRLPRVVNVQGLFDLQNLGMTMAESLPNITGSLSSTCSGANGNLPTRIGCMNATGTGLMIAAGTGSVYVNNATISVDASRSSSTYHDNAPVQQEAIQYPYFIQIATGSETENNIVNEIELNNPYSLFDSKYSDHELNNLSWLKSEGQWNAKAVYPTAYDKLLKVYNGTETVEGLSVKLSTETYTDYDFVLNTAEETFRLPLKNGEENIVDYTKPTNFAIATNFTAPLNGVIYACANAYSGSKSWYWTINGGEKHYFGENSSGLVPVTVKVKKGDVFYITGNSADENNSYFYPFIGNGTLYYYVGETVQNANLIDAGRIGEQLAGKVDLSNTQWAVNACMPDYSARVDVSSYNSSTNQFTAPVAGWLIGGKGTTCLIYINDYNTADRSSGTTIGGISVTLPMSKGDKYYRSGDINRMVFCPAKGAQ